MKWELAATTEGQGYKESILISDDFHGLIRFHDRKVEITYVHTEGTRLISFSTDVWADKYNDGEALREAVHAAVYDVELVVLTIHAGRHMLDSRRAEIFARHEVAARVARLEAHPVVRDVSAEFTAKLLGGGL